MDPCSVLVRRPTLNPPVVSVPSSTMLLDSEMSVGGLLVTCRVTSTAPMSTVAWPSPSPSTSRAKPRWSVEVLASSLFLGSALLLSLQVPPVLFPEGTYFGGLHKISLMGMAGCIVSIMVGLRLLLAIAKSGRLDRQD